MISTVTSLNLESTLPFICHSIVRLINQTAISLKGSGVTVMIGAIYYYDLACKDQ